MRYRVFTCSDYGADTWVYRDRLEPLSWRSQTRGLGSATLRLLQGVSDAPVVNEWIAIVDTDGKADPTVFDSVSDSNRIEWWGYINLMPVEVRYGGTQTEGQVIASEFGYYLSGLPIVSSLVRPQYNPIYDGVMFGNAERVGQGAQPVIRYSGFDNDVSDNFWTVKEILRDLVEYVPFNLSVNFSSTASLLDEKLSASSYEGQSLIDALDELLAPLSYRFVMGVSSGEVEIDIYETHTSTSPVNVSIDAMHGYLRSFNIIDHEDSYGEIILRGNRVRNTFSITTYGPATLNTATDGSVVAKLMPAWTVSDLNAYLAGQPVLTETPNNDVIRDFVIENFPASIPGDGQAREQEIQSVIANIINASEEVRRTLPDVYRRFTFTYGPNRSLWTSPWPGMATTDNAVRLFPRLRFQNALTQAVLTTPEVVSDQSATPHPLDWNVLPETTVTRPDGRLYPSTYFYRTVGRIDDNYPDTADGEPFRQQLWVDGTISADGFQNGRYDVDGIGLYLDVASPESLGAGNDSIFADVISSSSYTSNTYGVTRKEWSAATTSASNRNPDFVWTLDQTHWSRLVFTLCVETAQHAEWRWTVAGGNPERVKLIEDDTLDCWITCPGTVIKTSKTDPELGGGSDAYAMNYLSFETPGSYRFDRYSGLAAEKLLLNLYSWYGKPRRSVSLETNVQPASDTGIMPVGYKVGQFIGTVTENTVETPVNSAVASVEVILDDAPRRIVTTEIPAAPPLSRFRRMSYAS